MKFSDFVCRDAVRSDITAEDKPGVIRELVQALVDAGSIVAHEADGVVKAILKREDLGSTGIGNGVAVPHTKHPGATRLLGMVGVCDRGVDFDSLDGEKVHLFFLLVSPPDRPGDHLRALENISRQLREDTFCRFLKRCRSPGEILALLDEADAKQG